MKRNHLTALTVAFAILALTCAAVPTFAMDNQIESSARDLYVFKTLLKGDDVTITSKDGVVTLTGTVSDEPRRLLAEETMASVLGVKSVVNKLEIKGDRPAENSDGWIAARVKTTLFFHRSVSAARTEVSVSNGTVTLRGEAANQAQRELTTEYVKDVEGVKDVKNDMTVAKAPGTKTVADRMDTVADKMDDASITGQVKMSLLFHRSTRVLRTKVETNNGEVTLGGAARNRAEIDLVSKLVSDVPGVTKVNNRMTVEEPKTK